MMERGKRQSAPGRAEGVIVGIAELAPVLEADRQLDGGLCLAEEISLVDPEDSIDLLDRRDRCLAHADDTDVVGLDEFDLDLPAKDFGQQRGRHPSCCTAAQYDDLAGRSGHCWFLPTFRSPGPAAHCRRRDPASREPQKNEYVAFSMKVRPKVSARVTSPLAESV